MTILKLDGISDGISNIEKKHVDMEGSPKALELSVAVEVYLDKDGLEHVRIIGAKDMIQKEQMWEFAQDHKTAFPLEI